ncbi:hypothetical protein BGX24_008410 [Mortierella sp. AD032]|nr:hypothetical protein BGX24_008410 [Mortierella sp. AD032]
MKRDHALEELSSDSMMDQCEPQREWSTSSSQHTTSPSPVMCSSSYLVPAHDSSPPHQYRSLQKHYRHSREKEEGDEDEKDGKEEDCQLKRQSNEYRSKAQRMLYERHPPSPVNNNNNNNSRSASNSPSTSPLSCASEGERLSAPPSPVHAPAAFTSVNTLANRASFGSLRDYQSDRRQHTHFSYPQSHHRYPLQHPQQQQHHNRQQYTQQMSLPPSSSLSQFDPENRLPQKSRPQSHRHSYHGHHAGSASDLGFELPKLQSLAFSQQPESHSGSMSSVSSGRSVFGGSSGSTSSSNSAVFKFVPRPPTPASLGDQGHGQMTVSSHQYQQQHHHHQQQQQQPQQQQNQQQIQHSLPGTEGMTVVRNEEGAIMVYNPITDAMTFRCELCPGESFGRIHDLKRHQTSKHQEMTWPCDFCHRPFVRRDALLRHYTVKAARDDGLHPATHEVDRLLAARARAKMLY